MPERFAQWYVNFNVVRPLAIETDVTGSVRPRAQQIRKSYVSRGGKASREARFFWLRFKKREGIA